MKPFFLEYVIFNTLLTTFLGIIWGKDDWVNVFIKVAFWGIAITGWIMLAQNYKFL